MKIKGTKKADTLVGGDGDDIIKGGKGSDVINGGLGNDAMIGGPGRDIFIVDNDASLDVIRDFQSGKDRIMFVFDEFIGVAHIDDDLYVAFGGGEPMVPVAHLAAPNNVVSLDDLIII